jgi:hypothetical protein
LSSPAVVEIVSTNTTAAVYKTYILSASLVLTLPSTPSVGEHVTVVNLSGTTTCTIGRNGANIMSLSEDLTVDVLNARLTLTYVGVSQGWVITNE